MTPSDPRVGEVQARHSKITPGPWTARQDFIDGGVPDNSVTLNGGERGDYIGTIALHYDVRAANAEFIASAPADIAYLLAQLRARDEALWRVERLAARWATTPALRKGTSAVELRAALDDAQ